MGKIDKEDKEVQISNYKLVMGMKSTARGIESITL